MRVKAWVKRIVGSLVRDSEEVQTFRAALGVDYAIPDVENMQPQGLHFHPGASFEGAGVLPDGLADRVMGLGLHDPSTVPSGANADGEGGLYRAGEYKAYLSADGTLVLCGDTLQGRMAGDWVPRDTLLQAELVRVKGELDDVKADLNTIKTAISTAAVGTSDGGATFKGSIVASLSAFPTVAPASPGSTASDKVRIP